MGVRFLSSGRQFFLVVLSISTLVAHSASLDSLKRELKKELHDSTRVRVLNSISFEYLKASNPAKAIFYGELAEKRARKINYTREEGMALYNISRGYYYLGKYTLSINTGLKALPLFEKCQYYHGQAGIYNLIGGLYQVQRNYPKAAEYYNLALEYTKKSGNSSAYPIILSNISVVYLEQKNFSVALKHASEALRISIGGTDKYSLSKIYQTLGNIHWEKKQLDSALYFHKQAAAINQETQSYEPLAQSYVNMGGVLMDMGKHIEAEAYLRKAMNLCKELASPHSMMAAYGIMFELYYRKKNIDSTVYYLRAHSNLKDSIMDAETSASIAQAELSYKTEKIEKQRKLIQEAKDAVQNAKLERQQLFIWFAIIIAVVLFLSLLIAFRANRQKQRSNIAISIQNKIIEEKNKDITDSINYASRIQRSFLPKEQDLLDALHEHFILFRPKDIVSGDFYWLTTASTTGTEMKRNMVVFALADCTGHGVPGAMMTMIGNTLLNQTIKHRDVNSPADALTFLNTELPKNIKKHSNEISIKDGMDIGMIAMNREEGILFFSGANHSLYVIRNKQVMETTGDKQAVSASVESVKKPFTHHTVKINKGDAVYLLTDGYPDQFGGPKGKKMKYRAVLNILSEISDKPMAEQQNHLAVEFDKWKQNLDQVDDVAVVGIRV
ncbi:MAG: tetratricopeptide repeat protein [Flavobacteriales bacterium]